MAINTQTIRIDLNTGRTIPVAFAHQNDTNRQLTFQLYNNGVAFTPSSTTVKFAYKSPIVNGRYSVITGSQMASGTVSGNTVTVTLPAQYTQVSGVGLLTMILTTSGNTLRPVNIKFVCQGSADGDDTILNASDWPVGLYEYMDDWLAENEPTEIANLKSDLDNVIEDSYDTTTKGVHSSPTGWRLNESDGLCSEDNAYKLIKYAVTEGDLLKIVSDDRFQFQSVASVPSSGTPTRIGKTYGVGIAYVTVPIGATFLILSTPVENSIAVAYGLTDKLSELQNEYTRLKSDTSPSLNKFDASKSATFLMSSGSSHSQSVDQINVHIKQGQEYSLNAILSADSNVDCTYVIYDKNGNGTNYWGRKTDTEYKLIANFDIYKVGVYIAAPASNNSVLFEVSYSGVASKKISDNADDLRNSLDGFQTIRKFSRWTQGVLTDGAVTISTAVDQQYRLISVDAIKFADDTTIYIAENRRASFHLLNDDESIKTISDWRTGSYTIPKNTKFRVLISATSVSTVAETKLQATIDEWTGFLTIKEKTDNTTSLDEIGNEEVNHKLLNARKTSHCITLLHFSDIHADADALDRIINYAMEYGENVDDIICTGDMVANTYGSIANWWNPSVMTCIGNHDTASYSDGAYNWTALSMANRDAYYIAPFESNWGINHTSGKSYYFKDYPSHYFRLIVMDGMLYNDNGAEATEQTEWLANLLSDAIPNIYRVMIAIHAPHGGAVAKDCSFSKYGEGTMPTNPDCNTPQVVIDTVNTAIASGLMFAGYIVGHTHQDNVWDAENNGKQLMYCVTCASTDTPQWTNSDQFRNDKNDAFNLVTIDTQNNLVKIVRGGGADIANHMRTRKAICFNFITGEVVGEVL